MKFARLVQKKGGLMSCSNPPKASRTLRQFDGVAASPGRQGTLHHRAGVIGQETHRGIAHAEVRPVSVQAKIMPLVARVVQVTWTEPICGGVVWIGVSGAAR